MWIYSEMLIGRLRREGEEANKGTIRTPFQESVGKGKGHCWLLSSNSRRRGGVEDDGFAT